MRAFFILGGLCNLQGRPESIMTKEAKNRATTSLIILAFVQGPLVYHFTFGFFKILGVALFGLIGLILTIRLFVDILRNRATNTKYHIIGLTTTFVFGLSTVLFFDEPTEYLDWTLLKWKRNSIVDDIKKGILKPNDLHQTGTCHVPTFLPVSNDGNDIDIDENANGIISVKFFIDRGFVDHFSAFVYTNDPEETREFNKGIGPFGGGVVKKLDNNWYRVAY